jgi:hypothetical protein
MVYKVIEEEVIPIGMIGCNGNPFLLNMKGEVIGSVLNKEFKFDNGALERMMANDFLVTGPKPLTSDIKEYNPLDYLYLKNQELN